jgi:hypothetical protein
MQYKTGLSATAAGLRGNFGNTKLKTLAGMAASCLFVFATALPAEVYSYTGLDYGTVSGLTYSTSESVNGTFTLASPLDASTTAAVTPISWTVTDGVNTLCDVCGGSSLMGIVLTTDGGGNISDWYFEATNTGIDIYSGGLTAEGQNPINTDFATTGGVTGTSTVPGTWADTTSATPEPGTLAMLLAGSVLLFGSMRRRAKNSTE